MSVPDFSSHQRDPVVSHLARQCEESKTLGMFRLQDNLFLLVYDGSSRSFLSHSFFSIILSPTAY